MRSFDLVDFKVLEAHYFLEKMKGFVVYPEINFLFSSFVSANRSITFCLQAVLKGLDGSEPWYATHQKNLKSDPTSSFFVEARNLSQKVGVVPISGGSTHKNENGDLVCTHYFDRSNPDFKKMPKQDVVTTCQKHFTKILDIVFDCYVRFGVHIDPHQYLTQEYFHYIGKSIDDADEEIMGIRGYTHVEGWPEAYRWNALRNKMPGCRISELFIDILNKDKPHPPIPAKDLSEYVKDNWIPPSIRG